MQLLGFNLADVAPKRSLCEFELASLEKMPSKSASRVRLDTVPV